MRARAQRPDIGAALAEIINREVVGQLRIIAASLQHQRPGSVEVRELIERMAMPALATQQSRLVSEIADTVLAPALQRQRQQLNQVAKPALPAPGI
ncbi:MAG: hypothetical protein H7201_07030 [Candidatus Saccharibacteria bacterium]|nr:hypothetical protein [Microbacteriaceae bacterium]